MRPPGPGRARTVSASSSSTGRSRLRPPEGPAAHSATPNALRPPAVANPQSAGVHGGYLGVGLDAFGNYANDAEGRGNGCATSAPGGINGNSVGLRGPGDGFDGYCWLTGNLRMTAGALRNSTGPAAALRTVRITVTPSAYVTVEIDFNHGAGFQTVLQYQMPEPLPSTFKFGFAASTGGATDVHLIRLVDVSSVESLPEINLEKVVDQSTSQPSAYSVGDTVPYNLVVTNTSPYTITNMVVTDQSADDPPGSRAWALTGTQSQHLPRPARRAPPSPVTRSTRSRRPAPPATRS